MMFESEHERYPNIVTYGEHDDKPVNFGVPYFQTKYALGDLPHCHS